MMHLKKKPPEPLPFSIALTIRCFMSAPECLSARRWLKLPTC